MPWPPSSEDIECESAIVPDLLYNMVAWSLSSQSKYSAERVSNLPPEVHRLVLSLSQDLMHSVNSETYCPSDDCKEPYRER